MIEDILYPPFPDQEIDEDESWLIAAGLSD